MSYPLHLLWQLFFLSVFITGCANSISDPMTEERQIRGNGTLSGKVTKGPVSPAQTGDTASALSVPGVTLLIRTPTGQAVQSVGTDAKGAYSVSLPAGTYQIEMGPLTGIEFTKDLPTTITIREGQATRLDISIDTGIR